MTFAQKKHKHVKAFDDDKCEKDLADQQDGDDITPQVTKKDLQHLKTAKKHLARLKEDLKDGEDKMKKAKSKIKKNQESVEKDESKPANALKEINKEE